MRLRQSQQNVVGAIDRQLGVDLVGESLDCGAQLRTPFAVHGSIVTTDALELALDLSDERVRVWGDWKGW